MVCEIHPTVHRVQMKPTHKALHITKIDIPAATLHQLEYSRNHAPAKKIAQSAIEATASAPLSQRW